MGGLWIDSWGIKHGIIGSKLAWYVVLKDRQPRRGLMLSTSVCFNPRNSRSKHTSTWRPKLRSTWHLVCIRLKYHHALVNRNGVILQKSKANGKHDIWMLDESNGKHCVHLGVDHPLTCAPQYSFDKSLPNLSIDTITSIIGLAQAVYSPLGCSRIVWNTEK